MKRNMIDIETERDSLCFLFYYVEIITVRIKSSKQGRDSLVGLATWYGLDGPGIKSRWGRDIPHPSRPVLGSTRPPIQWVPGLSGGQSGWGVALTTHPF